MRDVLDRLLAQELVRELQLVADCGAHRLGYADSTGLGETLQSGGDIHPVTVDVVAVLDDVTQIDADAELDLAIVGLVLVEGSEGSLDMSRTGKRIDRRLEHGERGVAGVVHDATAMVLDRTGDQVEISAEPAVCRVLVRAGQASVADHICIENGGELAGKSLRIMHGDSSPCIEMPCAKRDMEPFACRRRSYDLPRPTGAIFA